MKRRLIVTVSLSLSLAGVPRGVLAQQAAAPVISGNVIGDCGRGPMPVMRRSLAAISIGPPA
jgi:hypothetical protein